MLHLFAEPSAQQGELLTITGGDVNHIKNVLRMRPGEEISVSNGVDAREYRYGIEEIGEEQILLRLRFVKEADTELPVCVTLFQGIPKADKMEWIVQKCVELGVSEIVPVAMERCVVKLDEKKRGRRAERWQSIAEAAAKQSRRGILPAVREPMTMQEAVQYAAAMEVKLLPYELAENTPGTRELIERIEPGSRVAVFIGPEGGFAPEEVRMAQEAGVLPVTLGRRILRTETAGMTVLSWLIYTQEIR
ncbi:16S rRNA (uracil(1498)-N(3))-methyltransferase [Lachnoclostridium sp. Marseille-P6806]|uniref:16S rRNA (uracil(1498)-N(3))-methyltransferase n=1 Tax=Lachnoclostridium sp. Marseille-P6806 TaxID=2364793 RepID=UPI001031BC2A|nr:16S rRNA (uracil(1498)-N(3))-methyltransferase [Lachnoclostridium sp. Marseille-P6806]